VTGHEILERASGARHPICMIFNRRSLLISRISVPQAGLLKL